MLEPPKCYYRKCKHYIGVLQRVEGDEDTEVLVCKAFPDEGIPDEIAYGDDPHTEVHLLQDNTIVFEKRA